MKVLNKKQYLATLPPGCRIYKFLGHNHNDQGKNSPCGLQIFDETQIYNCWERIEYIAHVELPDDCKVYVSKGKQTIREKDKLKILSMDYYTYDPKRHMNFDDPEICKRIVKNSGCALKHVKEQTEEICKLAVQNDGWALYYVKEQTEEICRLAIQQTFKALKHVKNQTPELCKLAIQQDSRALSYVRNQTPELCKSTVQQDGLALQYVSNKTDEISDLAVQQNKLASRFHVKHEREQYNWYRNAYLTLIFGSLLAPYICIPLLLIMFYIQHDLTW